MTPVSATPLQNGVLKAIQQESISCYKLCRRWDYVELTFFGVCGGVVLMMMMIGMRVRR